jgi:hypothetical protein
MKTQTLLVISAAVTAVLTLPVENYASYGHNGSVLTFPCGDNVPYVCIIGHKTILVLTKYFFFTSVDC